MIREHDFIELETFVKNSHQAFVNGTIEPRILESICIMVNVLYGRKARKNPANRNRFKKKVNVTIKAE